MKYGCIGEHLKHSFSAEIHHALSENPYEICEVPRDELDAFMQKRDFLGINVTIPYKEFVIPHLDWMSEQAKSIGAVNTVVNRDGKLYGYNTDFFGMSDLIRRVGVEPEGKKVAVLGTGGTARTALAVARSMKCKTLLCVSRGGKEGSITYDDLYRDHADTQIVINTTPCGMYPYPDGNDRTAAAAINVDAFPNLEGVIDAVYNPLRPKLVTDAQKRSVRAEGGLYMLVAQAVRASEIFLNCTYSQETVERVYSQILRQKENIVLTGMPGSGKSSVGKRLAMLLNREFFDLDEEIVRVAGCSIPEIFARDGEQGFRDLETAVLRDCLAQKNGVVLATGGGAILREENVDRLRRNGHIYFLDRSLELLLPTEDRPLASSATAIRKRYEERYARYCATADCRIEGDGSVEQVADAVRKDFEAL
ncbi:MAG: shikimate dehydrogenase [Clostridia bacterium]|nr:shikimate dehydrogenase [Clostridia bacterium]